MKRYTVWVDYGCEGWHPYEYDTLKEALEHEGYGNRKRVTQEVKWGAEQLCDHEYISTPGVGSAFQAVCRKCGYMP